MLIFPEANFVLSICGRESLGFSVLFYLNFFHFVSKHFPVGIYNKYQLDCLSHQQKKFLEADPFISVV